MYEIPPKRRPVRGAVTRQDVEAAEAEADFRTWLIDAIETDPGVRAALIRLLTATRRQPRLATTAAVRKGRGRQ